MHLDSLCAYLVFFCFFIIILVLLCRLLLFLFSCDLFKVFFAKLPNHFARHPFSSLHFIAIVKYLSSGFDSSHYFRLLLLARCALQRCLSIQLRISASGRRQTFLESTICVFLTPSSSRADLNLFYLLIALATTTTIFHWTKICKKNKNKGSSAKLFMWTVILAGKFSLSAKSTFGAGEWKSGWLENK